MYKLSRSTSPLTFISTLVSRSLNFNEKTYVPRTFLMYVQRAQQCNVTSSVCEYFDVAPCRLLRYGIKINTYHLVIFFFFSFSFNARITRLTVKTELFRQASAIFFGPLPTRISRSRSDSARINNTLLALQREKFDVVNI